ncbi:MAG: outer membrane-specific lipoprotein transporter subunit LolE [Methanomassiliicoccales archaeon PtaU1.Bin124]|nr:MAG: outer membrane-specific lipoprotein transporter subunit LolE [Methanomassiliicoccales archaeon PtaU1.Bin124]
MGRMKANTVILRGAKRRRFRNLAVMLCFAFIAGSLLVTGMLMAGAQSAVRTGSERLGPDMIAVPMDPTATSNGVFLICQPSDLYLPSSTYDEVLGTPGVTQAAMQAYVGTDQAWPRPLIVIAYEPSQDFTIRSLLASYLGRSLLDNEVLLGDSVYGSIGDTVSIFGQAFTVAGRLDPTSASADGSAFITMDAAERLVNDGVAGLSMQPGQISAVLIKADRSVGTDTVLHYVSAQNPNVLVFPLNNQGQGISDQLSLASQGLYLTVTVVILVSLPLILLISAMSVNERRREIGLMRSMGASQKDMFKMFFAEGIYLAAAGALAGAAAATISLFLFQGTFSRLLQTELVSPSMLDMTMQFLFAVLVAMLLAGTAALWPALKASRMDPYDAIRSGQN